MIEVLEPLEVRAGDTTSIDKHVRGTDNTSTGEDLLSSVGSGAVGALEDSLDRDVLSIASVERLFDGSGDHAVSRLEKELLRVFSDNLSSIRIARERAMLDHPVLDFLNIETIRVMNGRVVLNNSGNLATILLDELRGPVADGTKALDVESLALNAQGETTAVDERLSVKHFADSVVDTEASRLGTASDTTLRDELSSAAAFSVDVLLTLDVHVGVLDPGHGLLVGTHVRTEAINLSTNEVLLDKFHCVLSGNSLDLSLRVLARVNLDTTLGAAEGNVSDSKLEGHEGGKGLNLLQINVLRVASATLDGKLVR